MGYGYGVWLVLPINGIKTHIPHATIACNMSREDAFNLYGEFIELNGKSIRCTIDLSDYEILGPDYYEHNDASNKYGWSWGYNVEIEAITPSNVENLDIPIGHHITMQYKTSKEELQPEKKEIICSLIGKVEVVDIRSDLPSDWRIITE